MAQATNSVKGVVESTRTKTKSTRYGDKVVNYVTVGGQEISTGFKPIFQQGENVDLGVAFTYGEWQYQNVPGGTLPPLQAEATPATPTAISRGKAPASRTFPVDPTDGQMSIIRQNSMNRAVEIVDAMIKHGTIAAPANQDEYMTLLVEIALEITDFNSGQDIMKIAAAQRANKEVING